MNKNFRLLSAVLRGDWLIDEQAATAYLPVLEKLHAGHPEPFAGLFSDPAKPSVLTASGTQMEANFNDAPEGSIAIIPLSGPLMREDFCGDPGTETVAKWLAEASASKNIIGSLIITRSPGGTVDGTEALANAIKAATASKPVIAFVKGQAASAAYWAVSGATEIWAESNTDLIGSIGTQFTTRNRKKELAAEGKEEHTISATKSKDKNKAFQEASEGKSERIKIELLDPLNEEFLNAVQVNRSGKLKLEKADADGAQEPLTGKVYKSSVAKDWGLIDNIGTIEQAYARIQELSGNTQPSNQSISNSNKHIMKAKILVAWTALMAFFSLSAQAGSDHVEADLSPESLEKLNAELTKVTSLEAQVSALTTERDTAKNALTAATTERDEAKAALTASATKITELEAEVTRLGKQPGAMGSGPKREKDPIEGGASLLDPEAEHNKMADEAMGG